MSEAFRIEGYAIVSANGMIADSRAHMPEALNYDADKQWFARELDEAAVVVHGRNSHEGQANSPRRPRLILTHKVAAIAPSPDQPNCRLWNPAGATFAEACAALGVTGGLVAVIGGPEVYGLFLGIGYDRFHLSRAAKVALPSGVPVFPQGREGLSPEEVLTRFGLEPTPPQTLDKANGLTLVTWRRKAP